MTAIADVLYRGAPIETASKALILLHGRGGSARDMLWLGDRLCDETFFVAAPQAVNNIWYPQTFLAEVAANEPYLSLSVEGIKNLIDEVAEVIPLPQIYLAGFSQGACLSLEVSSRFATRYGGIAAFTGGLIGKTIDEARYSGDFAGTRVFIGNGDHDPYIPLQRSEESKALMERLGADVTLTVYPGRAHVVSDEEIAFVRQHLLFGEGA